MANNEPDVFEIVEGIDEIGVLKELRQEIDEKIETLRNQNLKPWKKASFKIFWKRTSEDVRRLLLQLAENGGSAYKEDILAKMQWEPMRIPGMLAGISNKSRNMGYTAIISREEVKDKDSNWRVQYKLNEDIKKFVNEISQTKEAKD